MSVSHLFEGVQQKKWDVLNIMEHFRRKFQTGNIRKFQISVSVEAREHLGI